MRTRILAVAMALLLAVSACGDDDTTATTGTTAPADSSTTTTAPTTTAATTTTTAAPTTTTTTTTLPPEPEFGWMAWEFAEAGDQADRVIPCPDCNAGVAPLTREAEVRFVDAVGKVWATHGSAGLVVWNPVTGKTSTYGPDDGLLDTTVYDIVRHPNGDIWLGTYGGANVYRDGRFEIGLTDDTGLVGVTTWDLWIDSTGTVWTDTSNGYILTAFDGENVRHFSDADLAAQYEGWHEIEAVFPEWTQSNSLAEAPDGSLWLGTNGNGLFHYDGTAWTHYSEADGLATGSVSLVEVDHEGTVWMYVIDMGLTTFDGATFTPIDLSEYNDGWTVYPMDIGVGPDGTVYVAGDGLYAYRDGSWEATHNAGGLELGAWWITFGEDGSIWVGDNTGIARWGEIFDAIGLEFDAAEMADAAEAAADQAEAAVPIAEASCAAAVVIWQDVVDRGVTEPPMDAWQASDACTFDAWQVDAALQQAVMAAERAERSDPGSADSARAAAALERAEAAAALARETVESFNTIFWQWTGE